MSAAYRRVELNSLGRLLSHLTKIACIRDPILDYGSWISSSASIARSISTRTNLHQSPSDVQHPQLAVGSHVTDPFETELEGDDSNGMFSDVDQSVITTELPTSVLCEHDWDDANEGDEGSCQQFQLYPQNDMTLSDILPPIHQTSIPAQMTAFHFSSLVPMAIVSRFPPTHRTFMKADNATTALRDMVQLGHIWSMLVGPAPRACEPWFSAQLWVLSQLHIQKLCKLMEEGLHRLAYWSMTAKISEVTQEGIMDDDWWHDFAAKIAAIGTVDAGTISQQLITLGRNYIDVIALESAIDTVRALNVEISLQQGVVRHDSLTDNEEEKAPANEATRSEDVKDYTDHRDQVASRAEVLQERCTTQLLRQSTMAASRPLSSRAASDIAVKPFRSLPLKVQTNLPVAKRDIKESGNQTTPTTATTSSSTSEMLEEVHEALNEAIVGRIVAAPQPMKIRRRSQVPRPLVIKKSRSALLKAEHLRSEPSHITKIQQGVRASTAPVTRESGWISAADLKDLKPEEVLYQGPPKMSNKARGKLPVAWVPPIKMPVGHGISPPQNLKRMNVHTSSLARSSGQAATKLPTSSTRYGEVAYTLPVPSPKKPKIPARLRAKTQGAGQTGPDTDPKASIKAAEEGASSPPTMESKPRAMSVRSIPTRAVVQSAASVKFARPNIVDKRKESEITEGLKLRKSTIGP